jgi:hypothetical protein
MKRLGLGIMGGALLMFLLPMTLSSCAITCGCLTTPDPNWTPAPIAPGLAAQDAAKIAGVPSMTVQLVPGLNGRQFYRATAPDVIAFVDAISGTVLEVVFMETMPGSVAPSVPTPTDGPTDTDTRRAAEAFMTGRGMPTMGMDAAQVTSVEFAIDFSSGAQLSTSDLRLGAALVRIDAATGGGTTVES